MAQQDLEDYAQGLGGGSLPQQGSMLPAVTPPPMAPSALGTQPPVGPPQQPFQGLPLGPRPPQPTPGAGLVPPTGQAPLMSLGGQPAPLEQMIMQRLQTIQGFDPNNRAPAASDAYLYAMKELPMLQQQASIRSQARDLQMKALTDLAAHAKDFSALPPEQQAQQGPLYQQLLKARAQIAGLNLGDEDVAHVFSSPNLAGQYASVLNDALIPKDQAVARLSSVAAGKPREDALGQIQAEANQRALATVQQYLPQAIAQYGGTPDKPIDAQTLMAKVQADPELGKYLKSSSALTRALSGFLSDKANSETLAGWGVKPGVVSLKAMEAQAAGPALPAQVNAILGGLPGPDGKPLTAAKATPQQIAWANQANAQFEIAKAANQGLEVEKFKRTLPAPPESRDQHVDVSALVNTGDIVKPPPGTTVEQLNSGPYRFANPTQQKALMALKPQRTAFADMNAMAGKLIQANTWQEAVPQGVRLYAGAVTGADPMAAAYLAATNAATSYLARMVESGVMTDQDVARWKQAATASFFDTKTSRELKIALMGDIMDTAQQSVISQVAGVPMKQPKALQELLNRLDQSTADTWKNSRAGLQPGEKLIRGPQGIMKLQKGYPVPQGWEEIK